MASCERTSETVGRASGGVGVGYEVKILKRFWCRSNVGVKERKHKKKSKYMHR